MVYVAAAVVAAALLIVALYSRLHRSQRLSDKDTIVLADFANTTGDTVFDDALKQGLSVQLTRALSRIITTPVM